MDNTVEKLSSARSRLRTFWILLFIANAIAIIVLWYTGSSHYYITNPSGGNLAIALGRLGGLALEYTILVQLILIARVTPIEQSFGFDKMIRFHRWIGYSLVLLLIGHPLLLSIGYGAANNTGVLEQTGTFFATWEDVFDAFIGTVLFTYVAATSIPYIRKKLRYELWHFTHLLTYVAVALAFGHQINSGDVARGTALYYWIVLNFLVFGSLLAYRFGKPLFRTWYFSFAVAKIELETPDVRSVYITGRDIGKFHFRAGQYANISFLQKNLWTIHPFSLSKEEDGKYLRFTMKELGDHTKRLGELRVGTPVVIDGPHGLFVAEMAKKDKFLFIAGGIGVTPLRAMIGSLVAKGKDATLLYGVRTEKDIAFRNEFDELGTQAHCHIHYIVSTGVEGYERGYVDAEKLMRLVPDFTERDIFICGPAPMMDATTALVKRLGVTDEYIHFEKFSF